MFRNRKYHFDIREHTRKLKRYFEGNINYRKLLIVLFIIAIIILYIGPYIFSWIFTRIVDDGGECSRLVMAFISFAIFVLVLCLDSWRFTTMFG